MPLITLCGGPLSGKTAITERLTQIIKDKYPDREIFIVNYASLKADPKTTYDSMIFEKKLNTQLLSMVEQYLTSRRIVIVDMPNLTKSIRYQLHGKANFAGTTSCVVYCDTPYEDAKIRNDRAQIYSESVFEDLWNRLEPPIATCRWDHPLFTHPVPESPSQPASTVVIPPTPAITSDTSTEQTQSSSSQEVDPTSTSTSTSTSTPTPTTPLNEDILTEVATTICEQTKKQFSKANLATRSESGVVVNMVDRITADIIDQIVKQQEEHQYGQCLGDNLRPLSIHIDITPYLPQVATTTPTTPTPAPPETAASTAAVTSSSATSPADQPPTPPTATSGLKLVRKTVRGTARSSAPSMTPKLPITLAKPIQTPQLLDLKLAFTRIVHMMNLKSNYSLAKGFVDYLIPHITKADQSADGK